MDFEFWRARGFLSWAGAEMGMEGVWRRVVVSKGGMLGEVARYYADDYILWRHAPDDVERVLKTWRPVADVMVQRVVFWAEGGPGRRRSRAFLLGLRGYLETYTYGGGDVPRGMEDLAVLIDEAAKKSPAACSPLEGR